MATVPSAPPKTTSAAFHLTLEQQATLDLADTFARNELAGVARRMDDEEWWPPEVFRQARARRATSASPSARVRRRPRSRPLLERARPPGRLALEPGGRPLAASRTRTSASTTSSATATPSSASATCRACSDGTKVGALALTEPGAGSDALGSMAHHRAPRRRSLRAQRHASSTSPTARSPTSSWSTPRPTPTRGAKGISAFVVEPGIPGFRVAQKLEKMGFRGSRPASSSSTTAASRPRTGVGEENAGVARRDERARPRARDRRADCRRHRRARPRALVDPREASASSSASRSASFQMIQRKLADMYAAIESMKRFTYGAGRRERPRRAARAAAASHTLTAASVLYCAEATSNARLTTPCRSTAAAATSGRWRSTASTARPSCSRSAPARARSAS